MFYSKWKDEYNLDLQSAISETFAELMKDSKYGSSTKPNKWLDDFQLRERYKGREEQIESIKKCRVDGVQGPWRDGVGGSRVHEQ